MAKASQLKPLESEIWYSAPAITCMVYSIEVSAIGSQLSNGLASLETLITLNPLE
jgi:hypothetical protein